MPFVESQMKPMMYIAFIAYLSLLPAGYFFRFHHGLGIIGIWMAFFGLTTAGILLPAL